VPGEEQAKGGGSPCVGAARNARGDTERGWGGGSADIVKKGQDSCLFS
jgi:hypothetical protein